MEWVEVRGKTIEVAVEAAMHELGIAERDRVEVEVIQEPEKGFLGIGGRDAIVKVKPKPPRSKRRRRKRKGGKDGDRRAQSGDRGERRPRQNQGGRQGGKGESPTRAGSDQKRQRDQRRKDTRSGSGSEKKEGPSVAIEEQKPVVEQFLGGLVQAFGLEGNVGVTIDGDTIVAEVEGPQTEAMVGPRGSVISAIHELTKTVLQRKTQASARVRLDIAGYGERRRQALSIYADQLIDQVLEEGGEIMLEPMSAGDRKVIHDAVAAREGVRSYSEGESPKRYVVIARTSSGDEEE